MHTYPCVQCGYCCSVSACSHGEYDCVKKRCKLLNANGTCSKYEEIKAGEDELIKSGKFCLPMMGSGCSLPLCNDVREAKMREKGMDVEAEQKQIEDHLGISLGFSSDFPDLWED